MKKEKPDHYITREIRIRPKLSFQLSQWKSKQGRILPAKCWEKATARLANFSFKIEVKIKAFLDKQKQSH